MTTLTRRQWLHTAGATAALLALPSTAPAAAPYELPKLPYGFDALEPAIDAKTMEIHHDKHHKAYVDNLNKALAGAPDVAKKPLEDLLRDLKAVPESIRAAVQNNGGGHFNHTMFWEIMAPKAGGEPTGPLGDAIKSAFGDFTKFKAQLKDAALKRFGSGWAWLVAVEGRLRVVSTANQDTPLALGLVPLLGIDVWEHAYYLKYQNKRPDYVDAWWQTVNWKAVSERHAKAKGN